jgi:uncharacterized protein YeaO (DUF488 family)
VRRRALRLKRVYEEPGAADGMRVLVDGLWPRGLSRQRVAADLWLRDAAPSPHLRRWYGHDVRRWDEFRARYRKELSRHPQVLDVLDDLRRRSDVTLVFGARDVAHSHAAVLLEILDEH